MSATGSDPELRRAFAELRAVDRRSTPGLDAVLGGRARRSAPSIRAWSGIVALAAVLLVVAMVVVVHRPPRGQFVQSISEWRAPTDVLLQTPAVDVLRSVPSLESSVLGGFGAERDARNGRYARNQENQ